MNSFLRLHAIIFFAKFCSRVFSDFLIYIEIKLYLLFYFCSQTNLSHSDKFLLPWELITFVSVYLYLIFEWYKWIWFQRVFTFLLEIIQMDAARGVTYEFKGSLPLEFRVFYINFTVFIFITYRWDHAYCSNIVYFNFWWKYAKICKIYTYVFIFLVYRLRILFLVFFFINIFWTLTFA